MNQSLIFHFIHRVEKVDNGYADKKKQGFHDKIANTVVVKD